MNANSPRTTLNPTTLAALFIATLITVSILCELIIGSAPIAVYLNGTLTVLPSLSEPALLQDAELPQTASWVLWPLVHISQAVEAQQEGWKILLHWWLRSTRHALLTTVLIASAASVLGILFGWLAAWGPRVFNILLLRSVAIAGALPSLVVLGVLRVSNVVPHGLDLLLVLSVLRSIETSHLVRSLLCSLGEQNFLLAARGIGGSPWHILRWHLLPHLARPLAALATTTLISAIALEAALTLIGLGPPAQQANWGSALVSAGNAPALAPLCALASLLAVLLSLSALARQLYRDRWIQRHHA